MAAHHVIKGGIQTPRLKSLARFDLLAAVPPMGGGVMKEVLPGRLYGLGSNGFGAKLDVGGD
jgi:hypothetical protein